VRGRPVVCGFGGEKGLRGCRPEKRIAAGLAGGARIPGTAAINSRSPPQAHSAIRLRDRTDALSLDGLIPSNGGASSNFSSF